MILGARQRREEEELEHVERHFLLDDLDVAPRRFRRVVGEAEDVAGIGPDTDRLPGQQHVAVFGDLVLPLLGGEQIIRIDVLEPDEDAGDAGAFGFGDEIRNFVAQRVDLDQKAHVHAVLLAQLDDAVEDRFPVLVAGEIVVGDEEAVDAVFEILAQDALDVIRTSAARFAALHIDDGAERALERTAAAGVEGRHVADGLAHRIAGQERRHRIFQRRQIVDVIVYRFERADGGIAYHLVHAAFGLAGEQRDAHVERFLQVGPSHREHRQHAGDMEAADDHRDAGGAQWLGDVQRRGYWFDCTPTRPTKPKLSLARISAMIRSTRTRVLVSSMAMMSISMSGPRTWRWAQSSTQPVDARQRIRRHRRAEPADDIAVVVVMRRLYQDDAETLARAGGIGPRLTRLMLPRSRSGVL